MEYLYNGIFVTCALHLTLLCTVTVCAKGIHTYFTGRVISGSYILWVFQIC